MNFIHSIKFKITLLYLLVLAILLVMMSCGIYFTLSALLYHNLDSSLKARAKQLTEFRNIIGIIASGTFEEASGENISFFFQENERLMDISSKGQKIPVNKNLIEAALKGKSSFSFLETPESGKMRIYICNYIPDVSDIMDESRPEPRSELRPELRPEPRPESRPDQRPDTRTGQRPDQRPGSGDPERRGPAPPPERSSKKPLVFPEIRTTALAIARTSDDVDETLGILKRILMAAVPLTLAVSGAGGIFLSRRAFRPVEAIVQTAEKIGASDLSRRIEVRTKDELGHLASTLNLMIGRLEKAFERQKQFTSDASHELRAPLAIIQAESSLSLQKERKPEDYQKSLEIISVETEHMSAVINQLLTLARGDSGKDLIKVEEFCLTEFMGDICSDVEILCQEKELRLVYNPGEKIFVRGDMKSLRRLMLNLLDNAMKYTPSGGTISVELRIRRNIAEVSVTDTGMGISQEDLPYIFERFYRVDKARTRDRSGSGLGLAICRQIAEMHDGSIDVESRLNKGTAFHFRMPFIDHP